MGFFPSHDCPKHVRNFLLNFQGLLTFNNEREKNKINQDFPPPALSRLVSKFLSEKRPLFNAKNFKCTFVQWLKYDIRRHPTVNYLWNFEREIRNEISLLLLREAFKSGYRKGSFPKYIWKILFLVHVWVTGLYLGNVCRCSLKNTLLAFTTSKMLFLPK